MKIITVYFDYPGTDKYKRCLNAFRNSVKKTNPEAELIVIEIDPPLMQGDDRNKIGWVYNHVKLKKMIGRVLVEDSEDIILCDCDTVFLRDASELFKDNFDIAMGRRPGYAAVPYNGGVVLCRPTWETKCFMTSWLNTDTMMLNDYELHMKWRDKYNGQNQASFGCALETKRGEIHFREYPTALMNACEQDWPRLPEVTPVILHVRKRLLSEAQSKKNIDEIDPALRAAVKVWRGFEKA
jgi:hypothetical protein